MTNYDRAITVFSPDGQLLQVKYAQEAVKRGSAAVGIRGTDVIVLAVEKRTVPKLQDERTEKKIVALDEHVLMTFAGLRADARVLVARAQIECQSHRLIVEDAVTIEYITRYIAEMTQRYTQNNGRRPFGIACLIAGFDIDGGAHLFHTEPSGIYYEWKACCIGRCDKTVLEYLERNYKLDSLKTDEAVVNFAIRSMMEVTQPGKRVFDIAVIKKGSIEMLDQDVINSTIAKIEKEREYEKKPK